MSSLNFTLSLNTAFVRPPLFLINDYQNIPHAEYYYAFLGIAFVVTVLGNTFVMFIIYIEHSFHTPKYMALFNLVLADLCETTTLIPNSIAMFLLDLQYISLDACVANMFFLFFLSGLRSNTLTILSYDRFVAICFPLRYHAIITIPGMVVMLTVAWAYSALFMITAVSVFTKFSFCQTTAAKSYFCDHGPIFQLECKDNLVNYIMAIVNTVFVLYVPLTLHLMSYVGIAGALFKIASWEGRLKAIKTCSAHLMLVAICYSPMIATYSAQATRILHSDVRIMNTILTYVIPAMMNPIIYVLNTKEIKEFSKSLFKRNKIPQLK